MNPRPNSPPSTSTGPRNKFHIIQWIFGLAILGFLANLVWNFSSSSVSPCLDPEVQESFRLSEKIYNESKAKTEAKVNAKPNEVNPWEPHTYPFDYFLASFTCPFSVQRLGDLGDGGKWVCGIERYKTSPCILYSFGISTETSFEVEMLQKTSCEIFAFDASVDKVDGVPPELQKRLKFSKFYAGKETDSEHTTLGAAMKQNGHKHIDIIKMDIEENEFEVFEQVISEFGDDLPFSQLLIEIHANTMTNGEHFAKLYNFFGKLERAGLRAFRNELNISPFVVSNGHSSALSEYSFINMKRPCAP